MAKKFYRLGFALLFQYSFLSLPAQDFQATQNWLTGVNFNTCMQRSKEILISYGYSIEVQSNGIGTWGTKPNGNAWLTCQACGDKTITTIILGNLPNTDMPQLRGLMLNYISTGSTGTSTGTGNFYTTKDVFMTGERIGVEFKNMPGNSSDWINIVPVGTVDGAPGTWQYMNGKKAGQVSFDPQPAGEYEARAFYNNSYKVEYRYRFRVGGGGIIGGTGNPPIVGNLLKLGKSRFAAQEKIEVQFYNLAGNNSDWINIVPRGSPDGTPGTWQYTGGKKAGNLTFNGFAAGEYEMRVFYNNSYKVEERLIFKVENP